MAWARRGKFTAVAMAFQILFIVLFSVFVKYDYGVDAKHDYDMSLNETHEKSDAQRLDDNFMPMFQDVHTMMYVGFGFLMVYMKRYGYSSVGFNFLTAAFTVQWATLMGGFLHLHDGYIVINIVTLFTSDFAAACVLISFGAVLGRLSPVQYILLAFFEIVFFQVNEWLGLSHFYAADVGGSMFVHVFGAYFGIAVAAVLAKNKEEEAQEFKAGAAYYSDLFSMIGTIFLWLFWPSFNSALAEGNAQHRAVVNTYYALAACVVVTFAFSALVHKKDKIEMEHIQNATLAGGVAIGTTADMLIEPWGAMTVGTIAAVISVLGFKYITPFMNKKLKLKDMCGVNNLHGMPGILAGVAGVILVSQATYEDYGTSLYKIFPKMLPVEGSDEFNKMKADGYIDVGDGGLGRTAQEQALYQLAALGATFGIAIVGGCITGLILKIPCWHRPEGEDIFEDEPWWHVEEGIPEAHDEEHELDGKDNNAYTVSNEHTKV